MSKTAPRPRPRSRLPGALLLASALGAAGIAWTAEPPAEKSAEEPGAKPATKPEADAPGPSAEVFIPTEEISEDFAVAFPVDI